MKSEIKSNNPLWILGATLLAFLPTYFIPYLHIDEGNWAAMGQVLFSGEFYKTWSDNKPPFLMEWFWLISLGAKSMTAAHFFSALWWALGAQSLARILQSKISEDASLFGGIAMGVLGATINYGAFSAELALTPFLIFATEIAYRQMRVKKASLAMSFLAGAFIALAFNIKPTAVLLGLFPVLIFLRTHKPWAALLVGATGGLFATWISWALIRVPFDTIWHEAIAINFQYVKFNNAQSIEALKDQLTNIGVALGLAYISVTVGSLVAMIAFIQKALRTRKWSREQIIETSLVVILVILAYKTVSLGNRYFQQYFVAILPVLAALSSLALNHARTKQLKVSLSWLVGLSLLIFQSKIVFLQVTDQNKNWNSAIERVIENVKQDSTEGDRIWVSNALGMIYHQTHRPPAVKYYFFLHLIKFAEICRADESELLEDFENNIYRESISRVLENPPRVIFWAQKRENSCSHRLKLENYPRVKNLIDQKYELVWESDLGKYYRLIR